MTPSHLDELAAWVANFRFDVEAAARLEHRLFTTMIDWSGALIAGLGHPLHRNYAAGLDDGGTGTSRVIGIARQRPPVAAAAANGAISHLWEVDDSHRTALLHPGVTIVPVVVALAQALPGCNAGRAAGAVVTGYETAIRVGTTLGKQHYRICHTTATAGAFGAAAAAAHLMGLDRDATLAAFGHAGTQAAGLWQFLDDGVTAAKAFHAALAVRNGMSAAYLAAAGIPGAPRVLEGPRGMFAAWGLEPPDAADLKPDPGRLMIDTVTVKNWPTCGQMHTALDCTEALLPALAGADIRDVEVRVPDACLQIASTANPRNLAEAKFSTSFCIAALLSGRRPDVAGLTQELVDDGDIQALSCRVRLVPDPALTARFPQERPARVAVTCADGREFSEERSARRGDPELGWSKPDLISRAGGMLALAPVPTDLSALVSWCEAFARHRPDWRAERLFDLVGGGSDA